MPKKQLNAQRRGNILALCDLPIRFGRAVSDADVKAIRLIRLGVLSFFIHRLNQGNRYHGEQSEDQQILQNTFQKIAKTKRARKHAPDQFHVFHNRFLLALRSRHFAGSAAVTEPKLLRSGIEVSYQCCLVIRFSHVCPDPGLVAEHDGS